MASNRVVHVREGVDATVLRAGIARIQAELGVTPAFPAEVEETARLAAGSPRLPDLDRTDLELVTIDPPGARDLDQALHLERQGDGYVVHYAIADLMAFVTPEDPVDQESHRRGQTLYGADAKVPLHPTSLSEGAASLLPDQERPALLWTITVDASGEGTDVVVERARVRSRRQLDYPSVQRAVDAGSASESLMLLREVGQLRLAREAARGGVSLPLPDQEVSIVGDRWDLEYRPLLPVEGWNAQISLLTGFAAAYLMVDGAVGILRTLPPPRSRDLQRLRRTARALGIGWPSGLAYPDFVRTLDPVLPAHAAMLVACTRLLRGSGYAAFDGEVPELSQHAALSAEYAHVTAPLRRLVDRYAGEICLALCAGTAIPDWVRAGLDAVPDAMRDSGRLAGAYERAVVDLVEAGVLHTRVGDTFAGVIVDVDERDSAKGVVTIADPAIEAPLAHTGELPLGSEVEVLLTVADMAARRVEFALRT